jgi:hypothetical protein
MMCHAPHPLPLPFHGVFGWIDKSHLKAVVATEMHGTLLTYCALFQDIIELLIRFDCVLFQDIIELLI